MNEELTKHERKEIKKKFNHGDMQRIADNLGYSVSAVYNYFNGFSNNTEILIEALRIIDKHEKGRENARRIISNNLK